MKFLCIFAGKLELMATIILEGDSDSTVDKIVALAKELGMKLRVLSNIEEEDLKLGHLMKSVKTNELVSEEKVLKALKEK